MPAKRQAIRPWKHSPTIAREKYEAVSKAILATLTHRGLGWGELVDRVQRKLPKFDGSVWWYTTACLRELESRGKVKRELGPPVSYSKRTSRLKSARAG